MDLNVWLLYEGSRWLHPCERGLMRQSYPISPLSPPTASCRGVDQPSITVIAATATPSARPLITRCLLFLPRDVLSLLPLPEDPPLLPTPAPCQNLQSRTLHFREKFQ